MFRYFAFICFFLPQKELQSLFLPVRIARYMAAEWTEQLQKIQNMQSNVAFYRWTVTVATAVQTPWGLAGTAAPRSDSDTSWTSFACSFFFFQNTRRNSISHTLLIPVTETAAVSLCKTKTALSICLDSADSIWLLGSLGQRCLRPTQDMEAFPHKRLLNHWLIWNSAQKKTSTNWIHWSLTGDDANAAVFTQTF